MAFPLPMIASISILVFMTFPLSHSILFIVLHGFGGQCSSEELTEHLSYQSGAEGYCIEVGDETWDSIFKPLEEQVATVCDKVKEMNKLSQGYNIVGVSQGFLIGRGVLEFCDGGPPSGFKCILVDKLIKSLLYTDLFQDHFAPSSYFKLPIAIPNYLENCRFLPKLNNELLDERNSTYKERFISLQNLVLIMTQLYIEDWIGLKTLDEAGRVKYISVPGYHLGISQSDIEEYVLPYL